MARLWPNGSTSIPRVTSEFGPRRVTIPGASSFHRGIDLIGFTYNKSSGPGTVTYARYNGRAGNQINVRHDDKTETVYMHNARIIARVGQRVSAGQNLGVMGSTGNVSGKHLHFETHTGWGTANAINPRVYMSQGGFAGGSVGDIAKIGTELIEKLQLGLGVVPDGEVGTLTVRALQEKVGTTVDGKWGTNSTKRLQTFIGAKKDGIWGNETTTKFKAAINAGKFGATGDINVDLSEAYIRKLQDQLGVKVDGEVGPATISALQKKVGAKVDGLWGPNTVKHLQKFVKVTRDGIMGNGTVSALKKAINASKFGTTSTKPPVEPGDVTRKAVQSPVNRRKNPTTRQSAIMPQIAPGSTVVVEGYAHGQELEGTDIWFHLADGTWAWSKGFTDTSTSGLTEEVVDVPEEPEVTLPEGYVYGVDVAWPQTAKFDWAAVEADNEFAIIKLAGAETGIYGPADLADKHLAGVRSVGLRAGFYFFNNGNLNIRDQAEKFIEMLTTRIQPGDIVCVDIEDDGSSVPHFTPAQAKEFAAYIELALGVKTFMYMNRSVMNNFDWSPVVEAGHPLWLAVLDGLEASLEVTVRHWDKADIVQFEVGRIGGYPGDIDRNFSTVSALNEYGFVEFPAPDLPDEPAPEDPAVLARLAAIEHRLDVIEGKLGQPAPEINIEGLVTKESLETLIGRVRQALDETDNL